jgi:NADH:ubiquinone oxidoreductase subunit 4 (subunit M)
MSGILVFVVLFPAVAAGVIALTVPRESQGQAKWLALAATSLVFLFSLALVIAFDRSPGTPSADAFQFESQTT